ncbi:MAG: class I SAM-dependent DNA methyltransferase [Paracoccaceae bacterium]
MADARTLAAYAEHAARYAARFDAGAPSPALAAFLARMPAGARILDLGCGPGGASAHMAAAGHAPDPVDASPEMVALARARGLDARRAQFDDLDAAGAYDGVWANFSLLHATRNEIPRHLRAVIRALRPGGWLHLGMKTGSGEARDALGRRYTYVTTEELDAWTPGVEREAVATGDEPGLDGTRAPYVLWLGRRT